MNWRRHSHLHPSLGTNLPGICIVHDLKLCQAGFAKLCKLLPAETVASCQEEQSMSASCSTSHLQCQISISTVGICFTQLPYAALIYGSNSSTDLVFWVSFCQATVIHLALPSPGTSQQPLNSRVCLSHPTPQTFDAKKERRSNRKLAALQKWFFRGTLCTGFFDMRNSTYQCEIIPSNKSITLPYFSRLKQSALLLPWSHWNCKMRLLRLSQVSAQSHLHLVLSDDTGYVTSHPKWPDGW